MILCQKCHGGELFRDWEPEANCGEDVEESMTITVWCKMCDQESKLVYVFSEEEENDE